MKSSFYIIFLFVLSISANAQTLENGNYTSNDGRYTITVEQKGDQISIIEPNKSNLYRKGNNNLYYHSDPKYSSFYIRVAASDKLYTGNSGRQEILFTLTGRGKTEEKITSAENCPLYDKYLKLSEEDPEETQAWVFCAAAALAKCTYNKAGAQEQVNAIIEALKSIIVNKDKCPCEDVITKAEWDSVPNQ